MLFSSLEFLYGFLPLLLVLYFALPKSLRNGLLLIFSLFFYYYGEQGRVVLLLFSVLVAYLGALGAAKWRGTPRGKAAMLISVGVEVGLLAVFKYTDFFLASINAALGTSIPLTGILLPIGISFYVFQTVSYIIDVWRGEVEPQANPLTLATYVALFPQLIAGPIVRYRDVAQELRETKRSISDISAGASRFVAGLGKKVLIANVLANIGLEYHAVQTPSLLFCWLYLIANTLHIYFDFSGYSDMAIGLGRMFGFSFPENFRYPFAAESISDFWRRWHMTLGTWFRDYVYFPLGGSRVGKGRLVRNLLTVWLLTGLWHGAAWNFVLWGLYFGMLLIGEKLFWGQFLNNAPKVLRHIYVAAVVLLSFAIFDAGSIAELGATLAGLFGRSNAPLTDTAALYYLKSNAVILAVSVFLSVPTVPILTARFQHKKWCKKLSEILKPAFTMAILIASTAFLVDGSYNPFLYFRF